jgi:hypothetical protein
MVNIVRTLFNLDKKHEPEPELELESEPQPFLPKHRIKAMERYMETKHKKEEEE